MCRAYVCVRPYVACLPCVVFVVCAHRDDNTLLCRANDHSSMSHRGQAATAAVRGYLACVRTARVGAVRFVRFSLSRAMGKNVHGEERSSSTVTSRVRRDTRCLRPCKSCQYQHTANTRQTLAAVGEPLHTERTRAREREWQSARLNYYVPHSHSNHQTHSRTHDHRSLFLFRSVFLRSL